MLCGCLHSGRGVQSRQGGWPTNLEQRKAAFAPPKYDTGTAGPLLAVGNLA